MTTQPGDGRPETASAGDEADRSDVDSQNPYLGLLSFTEDERTFFHGREAETTELCRLVERNVVTVLFGASGLGKTSLLLAGVFPRLREGDFLPIRFRLDWSPDAPPPVDQVRQAVERSVAAHDVDIEVQGDAGSELPGRTLWEYFHRRVFWSRRNQPKPLLVFDQFEELFSIGADSPAGPGFRVALADLVENRVPAVVRAHLDATGEAPGFEYEKQVFKVLISMREDFLPQLEELCREAPALGRNRMRLTPMSGVQAIDAVRRPSPGLVDDDVAERIVRFVAGVADQDRELSAVTVEPALLSLCCRELNAHRIARGADRIRQDLLEGLRATILGNFYQRSVGDLPQGVRDFVEERLVTRSGFRSSAAWDDAVGAPGVTAEHLRALVDRRLLRMEDRLGIRHVELVHDVLTGVVRESRDRRREERAREEARQEETARLERERRESEAADRTRRLKATRVWLAVTGVLLAAAVVALVLAVQARREADDEREEMAHLHDIGSRIMYEMIDSAWKDRAKGAREVVADLGDLVTGRLREALAMHQREEGGDGWDEMRELQVALMNVGDMTRERAWDQQCYETAARMLKESLDLARTLVGHTADQESLRALFDVRVALARLSLEQGQLSEAERYLGVAGGVTDADDAKMRRLIENANCSADCAVCRERARWIAVRAFVAKMRDEKDALDLARQALADTRLKDVRDCHDQSIRIEDVSRVCRRYGDLLWDRGLVAEARKAWDDCETLAGGAGTTAHARGADADRDRRQCRIEALEGRLGDAAKLCIRAFESARAPHGSGTRPTVTIMALITASLEMGDLAAMAGLPDQASAVYRYVLEFLEGTVMGQDDKKALWWREAAVLHDRIGHADLARGGAGPEAARSEFRGALAAAREASRLSPENRDAARVLAWTLIAVGDAEAAAASRDEALARYDEAVGGADALVAGDGALVIDNVMVAAAAHGHRAEARMAGGDRDGAAADWGSAVAQVAKADGAGDQQMAGAVRGPRGGWLFFEAFGAARRDSWPLVSAALAGVQAGDARLRAVRGGLDARAALFGGRLDEAARTAAQAVRDDGNQPWLLVTLAEACLLSGQWHGERRVPECATATHEVFEDRRFVQVGHDPWATYGGVVADDLAALKRLGIDHPDAARLPTEVPQDLVDVRQHLAPGTAALVK